MMAEMVLKRMMLIPRPSRLPLLRASLAVVCRRGVGGESDSAEK